MDMGDQLNIQLYIIMGKVVKTFLGGIDKFRYVTMT